MGSHPNYYQSPPLKAQRSMWEPEVVDDSTITVFSRHSRSDAHIKSQRLWHKFKPDKFPTKRRASGHKIQLLTKTLFAIDSFREREKSVVVLFCLLVCLFVFQWRDNGYYQPYPKEGCMPRNNWPTKNRLHGLVLILFWIFFVFSFFFFFFKRKNIKLGGWLGWVGIWERIWAKYIVCFFF